MLWILVFSLLIIGSLKLAHYKTKKQMIVPALGIIATELVMLLALAWCFTCPIRGEQITCTDTTGASISVAKDSIAFVGITDEFPYSLRDSDLGYTSCNENDSSCVSVYKEKFSTLKFLLSFKPKQNIVIINYNSTNKIL